VLENMSAFTCEHGQQYALFGSGGGEALATDLRVPLVGQVPLQPEVSEANDEGRPLAVTAPTSAAGRVFADVAERIATDLLAPIDMTDCTARVLASVEATLGATTGG
jgi:ATP-binding protein involved in chromosome partitioning